MPWTLVPGELIRRVDLHKEYSGSGRGGIAPLKRSKDVLVFSDPMEGVKYGYHDRWEDGVFHYTGEGQLGDQRMAAGNKAILNHLADGRALRVFKGVKGTVRYLGEFELDTTPWYWSNAEDRARAVRKVIVFRLRPIDMTLWARTPRKRALELGDPYTPVDETKASAPRDPFTVDPDTVDRGLRGHMATQNALAAFLTAAGVRPRRPKPGEPDFDLAWSKGGWWYVVEVKSLTAANETKQLRLGLGQVLDYQDRLLARHSSVRAVLAVERRPTDERWLQLCERHEVTLVWPEAFETVLLPRLAS